MRPAVAFLLFPAIVLGVCIATETSKEHQIGYVALTFYMLTLGICDQLWEQIKRGDTQTADTASKMVAVEDKTADELLEMRKGLLLAIEQIQALHQELEDMRSSYAAQP